MVSHAPKLPRPATLIAVALGGIVGASARVFLPWLGLPNGESTFLDPIPTALVNILGSALLGLVSGYTALHPWPEPLLKGLTTGLLGSFSTMSAVALIYSAFGLKQIIVGAPSVGITLLYLAAMTVGLVGVLWLTTLTTMGTYRLGLRMARRD